MGFVLEYAPKGELYDILFYTRALEENLARTYFQQIIDGLKACHDANVVHRDLKPQNLLFDENFNLKIADFGFAKICKSDKNEKMRETWVGTLGYRAPELHLRREYDCKVDVFAVGVILFVMLNGYPPFQQATITDKWFKPIIQENYEKFWKPHHESRVANMPFAKDLLERMLCADPAKRIDIDGIVNHKWFNGAILNTKQRVSVMSEKYDVAMKEVARSGKSARIVAFV